MKRAQIQLEEKTFEALRQRAFREKKSIAGLIRELIDKEMSREIRPKLLSLKDFQFIGAGKSLQGPLEPVSERHDQALEMEEIISATRAVREFSDLLNSIKFKGRTVIIERGGKPVARMAPIESTGKTVHLKDLPRLLKDLPDLGAEAEALEKDLREISKTQPPLPSVAPWD